MTLRLILMRHAKSGWGDPLLEDHQRLLNGRGRAAATATGMWLRHHNYVPNQQLISSSARTCETCKRLNLDGEKLILDPLYLASAQKMAAILQTATGQTVLMLGHNPGIAQLAQDLVASPPDHPRFSDYPTCATLIVDFEIESWGQLSFGTGQVQNFITPHDLAGA